MKLCFINLGKCKDYRKQNFNDVLLKNNLKVKYIFKVKQLANLYVGHERLACSCE